MKVGHSLYTWISKHTPFNSKENMTLSQKTPPFSGVMARQLQNSVDIYLISNHFLSIDNGPNYTQVRANKKRNKMVWNGMKLNQGHRYINTK